MGFLLFLVAAVALWVWYKKTHYNDSIWVKDLIKGRTKEQQAVIRYFCNEPSCLSKAPITDAEYDEMIRAELNKHDFKTKAMNKIGLDESEVSEIEPVHFEGFLFDDDIDFVKEGKDKLYRSSEYQVSWIFFSSKQVYVYQYTFDMSETAIQETTEEYFYKDVTNFATSTDTTEMPFYDKKEGRTIRKKLKRNRFILSAMGDKYYCSLEQNDYTERAIQGMKAMLREKKNA
ncbi:MAG: hypothetical protein K2M96_04560 [Prevotella sp.]|nr:hypothetical protein [Prevotella sp.]